MRYLLGIGGAARAGAGLGARRRGGLLAGLPCEVLRVLVRAAISGLRGLLDHGYGFVKSTACVTGAIFAFKAMFVAWLCNFAVAD